MKLSIFLKNKILNYALPVDISGSYTFDCGSENKVINVEAEDGKWVLFATGELQVVDNKQIVEKVTLEDNKSFFLKAKEADYLVYAYEIQPISIYQYGPDIDLIIGNDSKANINYNFSYFKSSYNIKQVDNKITLIKNDNSLIYVNNKIVLSSQTIINVGDEIQIFGLKIKFLSGNLLSVNVIPNLISVNASVAHLTNFEIQQDEQPEDIKVQETKLYDKDSYYSKSPRLRRMIEERDIKLSQAPGIEDDKEMPMILVIGPMLTMGMTSAITFGATLYRAVARNANVMDTLPQLLICLSMLVSMLLWPNLIKKYNREQKEAKRIRTTSKYMEYLRKVEEDIIKEEKQQRIIINENLCTLDECLNFIKTKSMNFWDKRTDQNDFLIARIGIGQEELKVKINYPEKGFALSESEIEVAAGRLVEHHKYLDQVPKGYSFYENPLTAVMGNEDKKVNFVNNILLQFLTYYSYDDLKIVVFTKEENEPKWDYLRYLNHNFNDNKSFRFFASNQESINTVAEYLNYELNVRMSQQSRKEEPFKPYYLIVTDCYELIKTTKFMKQFTELNDAKLGFSLIVLESKLSKLPSKCNNLITLGDKNSDILINAYEVQKHEIFQDEVRNDINMYDVARSLSNIPIEFESGNKSLPESINFLEMEKVGKVEQLNILNRWKNSDPINTLRAEVGVDDNGNYMYLDLHEKYHGPHGLVAGMTGSGKSEFIITYILSMAMNYNPDDVSFILIDYKGGGLAFAFENKQRGIVLPHLAGTITNLDKAEMDRTLVSINSEVKRRQAVFNEARDKLGESTIDIYKYQKFYKEGKLDEPVSHLFIICDEFAELKSQQPDFMDNLISVARIGRSLGVHLILATQKPSGVVNDQIWSNSKFRVCLKVQDKSDSMEMLKRPEAANLKEAGRFFLQVGYDEYFALGQSAWAGAKYYPSNEIVKKINRSVDFIDDNGRIIRSIEMTDEQQQQEAQGEQLAAIMNNIIEISNITKQKAKRLWLENIPPTILVEEMENKYYPIVAPYYVEAVVGEYDAPEQQKQGIVKFNYLKNGNTIIYGIDGSEREKMLSTLIYSTAKDHKAEEVEFYIVDYGSESLRKFEKLPHVGGIVYAGEDDKFNNLLKLIKEEMQFRKQKFAEFGGDYAKYIENSEEKLPLKVVIFNNYDSIYETYQNLYDELPEYVRDSERYGIVYIFTGNAVNSVQNKIAQNFSTRYTFKLNDTSSYMSIFDSRVKLNLRNIEGRGLVKIDGVHEFQVASIVENENKLSDFIAEFVNNKINEEETKATKIPTLPDVVTYDDVAIDDLSINKVPIGIEKNGLSICTVDYLSNIGNLIVANKLISTKPFVDSLISVFNKIENLNMFIFDGANVLNLDTNVYKNVFIDELSEKVDKMIEYIDSLVNGTDKPNVVLMIYGVDKFAAKVEKEKITNLFKKAKTYEGISIVAVEAAAKLKKLAFEPWYTEVFTNSEGVWVGKGVSNQSVIQLTGINKEMMKNYKNNMGYYVTENVGTLIKLIDFNNEGGEEDGK